MESSKQWYNLSAEFSSSNYVFIFLIFIVLTKKAKRPFCGASENSSKPDQTPQNDQVLHCLLTEVSFKFE